MSIQTPSPAENPRSAGEVLTEVLAELNGVYVTPRPDCILWMSDGDRGYGKVRIDGQNKRVHRIVWERVNGPIPDGLQVDHVCRVRTCVNVAHMELVTPRENSRRAARERPKPTHCPSGHEYTPENTMTSGSGRKFRCRTCNRAQVRRRYWAKKAAAEAAA